MSCYCATTYQIGGKATKEADVKLQSLGSADHIDCCHSTWTSETGALCFYFEELGGGRLDWLEKLCEEHNLSYARYNSEMCGEPEDVYVRAVDTNGKVTEVHRYTLQEEPVLVLRDIERHDLKSIKRIREWLTLPQLPPYEVV